MEITVHLAEYGHSLGPRLLGVQIFRQVEKAIEDEKANLIVIDLTGVRTLSSAFSAELFGRLYYKLGKDFGKIIRIKFDQEENSEVLKGIVRRAIIQGASRGK